jgi:hypothetical protein
LRQEAISKAQFTESLQQANDRLEKLINAAQQQLVDADAIPSAYDSLANDLSQEISATKNFIEQKTIEDSEISKLQAMLSIGDNLQQQLVQRWQLWQQFVRERDSANTRLDNLHSKLNEISTKPKQKLTDVRNTVEQLKVMFDKCMFKMCQFSCTTMMSSNCELRCATCKICQNNLIRSKAPMRT